jgi:hypothetical protein
MLGHYWRCQHGARCFAPCPGCPHNGFDALRRESWRHLKERLQSKARCGGATEVLRTTRMSGGIVERHRRCLSCGKTFFSCEAVKEAA